MMLTEVELRSIIKSYLTEGYGESKRSDLDYSKSWDEIQVKSWLASKEDLIEQVVVGGKHYITLNSHEDSMEFDVKCKELYLSAPGAAAAGFMLYASLTNIPTSSMYAVTGSGVTL